MSDVAARGRARQRRVRGAPERDERRPRRGRRCVCVCVASKGSPSDGFTRCGPVGSLLRCSRTCLQTLWSHRFVSYSGIIPAAPSQGSIMAGAGLARRCIPRVRSRLGCGHASAMEGLHLPPPRDAEPEDRVGEEEHNNIGCASVPPGAGSAEFEGLGSRARDLKHAFLSNAAASEPYRSPTPTTAPRAIALPPPRSPPSQAVPLLQYRAGPLPALDGGLAAARSLVARCSAAREYFRAACYRRRLGPRFVLVCPGPLGIAARERCPCGSICLLLVGFGGHR